MNKNILLCLDEKPITPRALNRLTTSFTVKSLGDEDLDYKQVAVIFIRFGERLSRDKLRAFPILKYIVCNATGVDHIDIEYCSENKIEILSLKGEVEFLARNVSASAEHTWLLLMAAAKKVQPILRDVSNGIWRRDQHIGQQLLNKNILIVGLGRNGKQIQKFASAFRMQAVFYDPFISEKQNIKQAGSLKDGLKGADFVVISVPLTPHTKHMFNAEVLDSCRTNVIIVNTSRGEIVEESALLDRLSSNKIGCYATDVISDEHNFSKSKLFLERKNYDNLVITPHVAGVTEESWNITEEFLFDKLLAKYKN